MKYVKSVGILLMLVLGLSAFSALVSADLKADIGDLKQVEVNDVLLDRTASYERNNIEKTDELEILVVFSSDKSYEDAEVTAELTGYDKSDKDLVEDTTDAFDVKANQTYNKRLNIKLPVRFEQGEYSLKITIDTPNDRASYQYNIYVDSKGHMLEIRDVILNPENEVKAGRALLVTARLKNRGESEEEDLKVKASVPALGISASDYVDELDEEDCEDEDCDDSTTSEELYMRIPDCAEPGEYTVRVCVEYDDGDEEECATTKINVVESDTCIAPAEEPEVTGKTIITIGPETQDITAGGSVMYPITIANQGAESKTYSISVDSADWAEFSITPSNVLVVGAGESKAAYVSVKAKPTATGLQVFSVTIKSGESVLKQVPLRANISGGGAVTNMGRIKKALEVGLVVLVVLLVILGLIIGFNKLKGSEEESAEGEEKTYY